MITRLRVLWGRARPIVREWWWLVAIIVIGFAIYWDRRVDARLIAQRDTALRDAHAAELQEARTHALYLRTGRVADSLEQRVRADSARAVQWQATAFNAAQAIERQAAVTRALLDSLAAHPPITLRDSLAAAHREVAVLRMENVELHNEHDAMTEALGAAQLALAASRQQTQLFRAAADSAIAALDVAIRASKRLTQQLARSQPPCTSGIPFVPCLSRKGSFVVGAGVMFVVIAGIR